MSYRGNQIFLIVLDLVQFEPTGNDHEEIDLVYLVQQ